MTPDPWAMTPERRDELLRVYNDAWHACRSLRDGHREALRAQIERRIERTLQA